MSKRRNWMRKEKKTAEGDNMTTMEIPNQKENKPLTKDIMNNMEVIDSEGNPVGNVEDIEFTIGNLTVNLKLKTDTGEKKQVPWEDIQAVGKYVILKPPANQLQTPPCPNCGTPLTYVPEDRTWYCPKEKKYV
jgi:sporulation protein YlmC with PRC-barrel domain